MNINTRFESDEETVALAMDEGEEELPLEIDDFSVFKGEQGKSAYEVAKDNGYEGTEQEWLVSLKGETGANGKDGADGLTPYIGDNGNWWLGETDTGVKGSGVTSWNELTDRPFGEEVVLVGGGRYAARASKGYYFIGTDIICQFIIGKTYALELDGVLYDNLVCFDDAGYPSIGSPETAMTDELPFNAYYGNGYKVGIYTILEGSSHTVKVSEKVITKLDEKFLPTDMVDAEIPIFNLAELGMSTHTIGGQTWFSCDTVEMRSAMLNGVTCFIIPTNFGLATLLGTSIMVEAVPNPQMVSSFYLEGYGDFCITAYEDEVEVVSAFRTTPEQIISQVEAKGYQTESQVTNLINNALGVIENGSY